MEPIQEQGWASRAWIPYLSRQHEGGIVRKRRDRLLCAFKYHWRAQFRIIMKIAGKMRSLFMEMNPHYPGKIVIADMVVSADLNIHSVNLQGLSR